ncbi:MAG: hypothetical protein JXB49_24065 [Bacteroidales bacterium]|nr:hypothetical protein [Bacteroidales bacterium]
MNLQGKVMELWSIINEGITYCSLVMEVNSQLSIRSYLPTPGIKMKNIDMSVLGHSTVESSTGIEDDCHHRYALELIREGCLIFYSELRGFSTSGDLASNMEFDNIDYWVTLGRQFTLVTEGFQHDKALLGETITDLIARENWMTNAYNGESVDVEGISFRGDLVLYYPVFSKCMNNIFCSESPGSVDEIFATCFNAPARCIPDILKWIDRSDITGLNVPRQGILHYGEMDTPGPGNHSAAYNKTVELGFKDLKEIYASGDAENRICQKVTLNNYY